MTMTKEVSAEILGKVYRPRKAEVHKYDFGHLLVVGGSKLYSGSPALNALAAYRTGIDLVTVVAPQRAADIIATFAPDLITCPVPGDYFQPTHLKEVVSLLDQKTAVVIGGGMGREKETLEFVKQFLLQVELPVVVDADAIYAAAEIKDKLVGKPLVFTPHAYEFSVLAGEELVANSQPCIDTVKHLASVLKSVVLLKGSEDIIADGQKAASNKTGNPFMTVGGTGDTLAGMVGSFLAQGIDPFTAACAAAYLNGAAGDLAAEELGPSLMASDLLDFIPEILPF
ncbi:NAD(P)H-hydrate dehydratase [Candidatus Parcubacteria bacterium]|nr:NAD(P)H-hydrate dehydratase [Candidatus Parcubacteria bacterium]